MKKQLLSEQEFPATCSHCQFGRLAPDTQSVLCIKRGVMQASSSCKKYRYDPLKRKPRQAPKLPDYQDEDFSL